MIDDDDDSIDDDDDVGDDNDDDDDDDDDGSEWKGPLNQIFAQFWCEALEQVHGAFSKQYVNADSPPVTVHNERHQADAPTCAAHIPRVLSQRLLNVGGIVAVLNWCNALHCVHLMWCGRALQEFCPARHQ